MNLGVWVMNFTEEKVFMMHTGKIILYSHVKHESKKVCWVIITATKRNLSAVIHWFVKMITFMAVQKENQVLEITRKEIKNKIDTTMITPHEPMNYWHLLCYEHSWSFHLKGWSQTQRQTRRSNKKDQRNFREWEECVRNEWGQGSADLKRNYLGATWQRSTDLWWAHVAEDISSSARSRGP